MAFKITIEKVDNALTCETGNQALGLSSGDIMSQALPVIAIVSEGITLVTLRKLLTLLQDKNYATVENITLTVNDEYAALYN